MVLAACLGFLGGSAFAKPWWSSPSLKYDEQLVGIYGAVDPHYMNKDESDQYLAFATGSGGGTVYLYSIPSLIAGTSSNDVAPIAQGTQPDFWNTAWKGIAVSDDLRRVFTGQTGSKPDHTSFPVTGPWVKNVNTFNVTNDPTNVYFDGCDFGHSSQFLYSDVYASGNAAVPAKTSIVKWSVTNLLSNGIGLVSNTVVTTSLHRIRNVSSYYIGGKDLVYYGEGDDTLGVTTRKVCVYDFDLGTETELVTLDRTAETGVVAADLDVMNVKVGGVGLGQMHLYVQCNDGAVYIYDLNADGKSVGALVKRFTAAQMKALVGDLSLPRIRNFEVTNDEKYAFVLNKPTSSNTDDVRTRLHIIWSGPAWFSNPVLRVKENVSTSEPRGLNKDENDQFLFLPSGISSASSGYLYSIPALKDATNATDVVPIASGTPSAFQPGAIIYQQNFDGIETYDNESTMAALGWQINTNLNKMNTANYSVHDGRIFVDNLSVTSVDCYAVMQTSDAMKPFCTNDYSYQYDVTYRQATTNNFRYFSLLCNYTGSNVYNTVDVRIRGEGYNQLRHKNNTWDHYNLQGYWPIDGTGTNSMMYLLHGVPYNTPSGTAVDYYNMTNRTITVRVEMSMSNGPSVYVNGMLVSKMDAKQSAWSEKDQAIWDAYALCFKSSTRVKYEVDNVLVWQGCGVEPVWKGGAISDKSMRVLTASSGSVNSSLPVSGAWTKDTTVFGITNDPTMSTAYMDAMDFGHDNGSNQFLYSYSDYYTATNNLTSQMGYQHKIYKWNVLNLSSNGLGFASNAVFTTCLTQLRNLDSYYIGGRDLIYYGEGQVGLAGVTRVCVLDPTAGTETVLINSSTNDMPRNVMNVKVSGVGLGQMHLYVQCEDGSLYIYELNDDGLSVGSLVKTFSSAQIKVLLGVDDFAKNGVPFTKVRAFEVTNDEKTSFFAYDGADGLYVIGAKPAYEVWKETKFGGDANNELIAGDEADPDGDGIVNALEYAMGLDPLTSDAENGPIGGITDDGYLGLSFRMSKQAFDEGVTYECETCTNLVTQDWTTFNVSELLPRADSNDWWQAVFQSDVPVTNAPQRFIRLKVFLP